MTITSNITKVTYNGDDSTTVFPVTFIFYQNSHIRVILRDALGAETVWVDGTHYTLAGGAGSTGTLTVKTTPTDYTPATGEKLLIKSAIPETQGAPLPFGGAFPTTTVEQMVDIVTRLVQQHSEEIARGFTAAETDDNPGSMPTSTERASKFLAFDAGGNAIASPGSVDTVTVSAFMATVVDDADAATARTTLGLGTAAVVNTGVANGNVPAMDATGYPAADGSQITNIQAPRGYVDGFELTAGADTSHDVAVASGVASDTTDASALTLSAAQTKQLDAVWATGTAAGGLANADLITANITVSFDNGTSKILGTGLFGGAANGDTIIVSGSTSNDGIHEVTAATANDATLSVAPTTETAGASITVNIIKANHLYNIFIADDGAGGTEVGFDDSLTATNFLALAGVGTVYRAVGYLTTDATANLDEIAWIGERRRKRLLTATQTWRKSAMLQYIEDLYSQGGGGGGTGCTGANDDGNPGGGGGCAWTARIELASLGATETATVGAAGAGGTAGNSGGNGTATSFGAHSTGNGGAGGVDGGTTANGGTATGGDINRSGHDGEFLNAHGGHSVLGTGGAPPDPIATSRPGVGGTGFGSAGSGARSGSSGGNNTGGAGRPGVILLTEVYV